MTRNRYMGVIPNPKMAFIFPISCILALIFPILIKYFPKCVGKGSFPKSQIKSLSTVLIWDDWRIGLPLSFLPFWKPSRGSKVPLAVLLGASFIFCFPSSSYLCAAGLKSCTEVPFPILTIFVLVARTVVSIKANRR